MIIKKSILFIVGVCVLSFISEAQTNEYKNTPLILITENE